MVRHLAIAGADRIPSLSQPWVPISLPGISAGRVATTWWNFTDLRRKARAREAVRRNHLILTGLFEESSPGQAAIKVGVIDEEGRLTPQEGMSSAMRRMGCSCKEVAFLSRWIVDHELPE
jgi:hypothetical protein